MSSYEPDDRIQSIPIDRIRASYLGGRDYDEAELGELADSYAKNGILVPLLVGRHGDQYVLVSGELRFRAAQLAGITEVPCKVVFFGPRYPW